jgi:hypothetical protein
MTETGTEDTAAAETAAEAAPETAGNRWWIGAAIVVGVPLLILNGVSKAARFGDGFLSHWYGQLAVVSVVLAGYALVHAMVGRAYRRRRATDDVEGVR